jgi:membrane associated rhomboid family serine protease
MPGVGNAAHLGGLACGFLPGILFFRNAKEKEAL